MSDEDLQQRRREEFRSWLFLTAIMAPVLAVLIVSGYGFIVWMLQATDFL
jgi:nitrate reductase NapE